MTRTGRLPAALLSAAVIGGLVASGVVVAADRRGDSSELRRLAAAVGPHRVTRARLTGGFAYAPCDGPAPNDSLVAGLLCERSSPDSWAEAGALGGVATQMRASNVAGVSEASRHHLAGSWSVIWGKADAAIEALQAAARLQPKNARVQSDLAAAFLARAQRQQDPQSVLDAHTAADSAVALDRRLPEAQFNRAVALEWLALRDDAIGAWSAYLEVDAHSPWADEARARRRSLAVPLPQWQAAQRTLHAALASNNDSVACVIARRFPARVRDEAGRITVAWARAYRTGASGSDTLLSRALGLSRALASSAADSLWLDAVQTLTRSAQEKDGTVIDATADGLIAYATGDDYVKKFRPDSALPWLIQAERTLTNVGSSARYLATYDLARVAWQRRSAAEALATLRRIRSTAPGSYRSVRALAARSEGVIEATHAVNLFAAGNSYSTAIQEGAVIHDPSLELRTRANLAANFARLGLDGEAWKHLYTALRMAEGYAEASAEGGVTTFDMAAELSWKRAPRAAALFEKETIRLVSVTITSRADSLALINALGRQAELLGRAGRADEAFESVRKAKGYLASIEPDSITAYYLSKTDLVAGLVWQKVRPDSALGVLRRVMDSYRDPRYRLELDRALLAFANAYAAVGAMDSAQAAFERAIDETERRRSRIPNPEDRARFLDQARPLIDQVLTFLVDRADTLRALQFLEHMRSRVLLEHVVEQAPNAAANVGSVDVLRSGLPRGTSLVSYAVLDREIVIWLIRRDGVFMYRRSGAARLEQVAREFSTAIADPSRGAELRSAATELHRMLIAPFEARLEPDSRVIFVPDKWLHFVPFAALLDSTSGKFVVERFETGIAPSLQLYAQSLARYDALEKRRSLEVLAVGNPAFDVQLTSLPRLPGAEIEANRVVSLYHGARLLVGTKATKAAFLKGAAVSDIVHFAGHGVVRPDVPLLSYLALAPDSIGGSSGTLTARELSDVRFERTRLAILSGCHTASGRLSDTEGASSLARALFAAGVPSVVASFWAVDDAETAQFFTSYHRRLSVGVDPTEALRRTQLEWLARERAGWKGFSTWAAFAIFGATDAPPSREGISHEVPRSSLQ